MAKKASIGGATTSTKAASAASDILRDGRTGDKSKTAAGSALSQHSLPQRAGLKTRVELLERRSEEAVRQAEKLLRKLG